MMFSKMANHVVTMYPNLEHISFIFVLKGGELIPLRSELDGVKVDGERINQFLANHMSEVRGLLGAEFPDIVVEQKPLVQEDEWIVWALTVSGDLVRLTVEASREAAEAFAETLIAKMGLQFKATPISGGREQDGAR